MNHRWLTGTPSARPLQLNSCTIQAAKPARPLGQPALSIASIHDWIGTRITAPNSRGGTSRANRARATSRGLRRKVMNRSAAPDTRNSRVSRQGLVINMASRIHSKVWTLCTCQP